MTNAIAQLVLHVSRREVRGRIAPGTALYCDDVEPLVGQLTSHYGAGPTKANDDNILFGKSARHLSPRPLSAAGDTDGRQWEALVVPADPIKVVVARARIADHFPRDHVAVTAINGVSKEPHLHIPDDLRKERCSVYPVQLELTLLQSLQCFVFVGGR